MELIIFLCSFLSPAIDCQRELIAAEQWQVNLFAVLPVPHDAHDDAARQGDYWQWCVFAHSGKFKVEDRAWFIGAALGVQAGRALR